MSDNRLAMKLLERQEQLDTLTRCLAEARAGSGKLVLIAGEAGFGKSTLVEQFVTDIKRSVRVLWGACDALDTPRALGPVHEIAAQTSIIEDAAQPNESRDWLFGALFAQLLPPQPPTVVVLEDVHWADESTLDFFRFIGRRIQRTSALFIATYRDEELSAVHPVRLALGELTGRHVVRMRLAALSPSAVDEMAQSSGRDGAQLHQITGGNPFFVSEVLCSSDEHVPETVRDAVLARVMRCSQPTRELAELVAISPGKTEGWLIEALVEAHGVAVDEGVARGLLTAHNDAVSFRHELARLAVHSTILPDCARWLHGRVLKVLEDRPPDFTQLVHHAMLANNAEAVVKYAPPAAREAARLGAHREAAAHYSAALRYGDSLSASDRAEFLEQHARECSTSNQTAKSLRSANQALELWRAQQNVEAQARVLCFLTPEYRMAGNKAGADESIAAAIALLEPLPPSVHLAMVYGVRSRLASNRAMQGETVEYGERALSLAHQFNDPAIESHALNSMGAATLIAGDRAGYKSLERSLAVSLEHKLDECAARSYCNLMFCATLEHDFACAEKSFRDGVAYCEERGLYSSVAYLRTYGARLALDRGDWTEAAQIIAELSQSTDLVPVHKVPSRVTLALVRIRRGDPGAEALLDEVFELALSMDEPERLGRVAAARAELAWYRGDLKGVVREAELGLTHLGERRIPWLKGELLFWQSRAQTGVSERSNIAEPYRLMLSGKWQEAAETWEAIGMPYEQALCLAEGSDEDLLRSLAIVDRLGAGSLEAVVRRKLRERGVRGVPRGPREATRTNPAGLSEKEFEVLVLLMEGCSNAQIARRLHRSTKTIDHHVSAILAKLEVDSRTEAITAAFGLGIFGAQREAVARRR